MEQSRGQVLVWVVAAVLATLAMVRVVGGADSGASQPVQVDRQAGSGASTEDAPGAYVHVAGRVRRPGLYRLPAAARVAEALEKAGGPAREADLSAVNLAAEVEDGQQIVLPRVGAAAADAAATGAAAAGGASPGGGGTKLSLAQASQAQLEELDGIGPTLAKRILEYRDEHGGFRSLGELKEVEGIGEKRFQSLSEAVSP